MELTKMERYKDHILFSLILLSQIHVAFRYCGDLVWVLNGVVKSFSLTTFLLVKHVTVFILYYIALNPRGGNKNLLHYLFVLSALDIVHFIVFSGFGYGILKLIFAFIILASYRYFKK